MLKGMKCLNLSLMLLATEMYAMKKKVFLPRDL